MSLWYYIGPHGQIGPLGDPQIRNLIQGNIIGRDTPLWRPGMQDWLPAAHLPELSAYFTPSSYGAPPPMGYSPVPNQLDPVVPMSRRSRVAAGVLNLVIPGAGRMYLGYWTTGVLQFILALCTYFVCCAGGLWAFVDGIVMLTGGVSTDADGYPLSA